MKRLPLRCLILFTLVSFGYGQKPQRDPCRDIPTKNPVKVFASIDGGKWRRYPGVKAIPAKAEAAFDRAEVFRAADGRYKIHMLNSTEENGVFSDYCFASDGALIEIKSEYTGMATWGARREWKVKHGRLKENPTVFFDVDTWKPIVKPQDASLDEFQEVKLYRQLADLPFKVSDAANN